MLNPIWLNTFKTLVKIGHFTQTAERLHMTQPGVSQHLKKLEQACGHTLVQRDKKTVELTEQGRLMYHFALQRSQEEARLMERLNFDSPYSGECRLACSGSLAMRLYPKLLPLQQQHSELRIHLEVAPNQTILNAVQAEQIDLGIVTHISSLGLYRGRELGQEPLRLVLPKYLQHQTVTPELLEQCGLIDHPDAQHYFSLYLDLCGDAKLAQLRFEQLPRTGYINQLSQILLPVAQGLGFTVLPESAIQNFALRSKLHVVEEHQAVMETLFLIHKRGRELPARYATLTEQLLSSFPTS
ncbi:LysR family transcriptional regulator [Vibrio profundum]|uniref:LysR family transcriptional regulator n=1 Tax=Vibrio profundum TaxID=2910247 RepID=UPI003D0BFD49